MQENYSLKPSNVLLSNWQNHPNFSNEENSNSITKLKKTYVGIDFGTSTTVVSVLAQDSRLSWCPVSLQIEQSLPDGGTEEDTIVSSVLAWKDSRLYFGLPAYKIKQRYRSGAGKTHFSSFKMGLGVSVGSTYPKTSLSEGNGHGVIIETAKDATREFFKLLVPQITKALVKNGLPPVAEYGITVPASFQANQRKELQEALADAGIAISESCFIDEPNAALLSYLFQSSTGQEDPLLKNALERGPVNILVFDFGAGTCDISILKISQGIQSGRPQLVSQNRAISRFTALGGDNIDRAIAKQFLYPQLINGRENIELTQSVINGTIIPDLLPVAEKLKIAFCEWMTRMDISTLDELKDREHVITERPYKTKISQEEVILSRPSLSAQEFAEVMSGFTGDWNEEESEESDHVYSPVADALSKAGMESDELFGVLFIGGSCGNPLVVRSIMDNLPGNVKAIVPEDLRCHVSQGAAIHSTSYHGFNHDLIQPITSEPICLITKGGQLKTLIKASTPLPSTSIETRVKVAESGQSIVELPLCLSSKNRFLGKLSLETPRIAFTQDAEITVTCELTREKLLKVSAECEGVKVMSKLLNPLSCQTLYDKDIQYHLALQELNTFLLDGSLKYHPEAVEHMMEVCGRTGRYREAVDYCRWLEKYDDQDLSTNICYYYSQAGEYKLSEKWGKKAYKRNPNAVNTYNCACVAQGEERIKLLRESLERNPNFSPALYLLGLSLADMGAPEGTKLLKRVMKIYSQEMSRNQLSDVDSARYLKVAKIIGDQSEIKKIEAYKNKKRPVSDQSFYNEDNLAATITHNSLRRNS